MTFSEETIKDLRERVKPNLSESRYNHTLGVERAAARIGEYLMPERVSELRVAALLHDITKEKTVEEHLELIGKENPVLTEEDLNTTPALHSFSAPYEIYKNYREFATDSVLTSTFYHTVGSPTMTIFDEIIFIADYVEEGRKYYSCISTGEFLFAELKKAKDQNEREKALHNSILMSIRYTEEILTKRGLKINTKTKQLRDKLSALI